MGISGAQKRKKKGEGRAREGHGAVDAWTDQVMDRVGVAS